MRNIADFIIAGLCFLMLMGLISGCASNPAPGTIILPPVEEILGAPALPQLPDPDKATRKDLVDLLYEYEAVAQLCKQK